MSVAPDKSKDTPDRESSGPTTGGKPERRNLFSFKSKLHDAHEGKAGTLVVRASQEPNSWEQWLLAPGREPELLAADSPVSSRCERILILPSSTLFSWPLWIAAEGEALDLVRLELSGRHLLKRGMEESLAVLPILRREDRQLLLAVAIDEPFPAEIMPAGWRRFTRFELPARLLGNSLGHDLILWEEWGALQMAFYRETKPVWFCSVRLQELSGLIHRIALRLLVEGVLEHLPTTIGIERMTEAAAAPCAAELRSAFPNAVIARFAVSGNEAAPMLRDEPFDLPPTEAKTERRNLQRRQKMLSIATAAAVVYLLLLIWGAGYLFIRQTALRRLQSEVVKLQAPALNAQDESDRWKIFRPVIDPSTFALDLLAAVAAPTDGGKIRLTLYSLEQGSLRIQGEATDVTQAYSFIEQLKKNPLLQDYNWTSGVPQIAGKDSVRFDLQGTRTDASNETTGS